MIDPHFQYLIYQQQERELTQKIERNRLIAEARLNSAPTIAWNVRLAAWLKARLPILEPQKPVSNECTTCAPACACD
jgi:hypothetical protein